MSRPAPRFEPPSGLPSGSFEYGELQKDLAGFESLAAKLEKIAGIHLATNAKNQCLMACRLGPVLRQRGLRAYADYEAFLAREGAAAVNEFVSTMTTNTTQFFREDAHFDILKRELPALLQKKSAAHDYEIRVWCAAASTGQEPYSIAMTLLENLPDFGKWDLKVLASDIDMEVLAQAAAGIYSASEASQVPPLFRQKYMRAIESEGREKYQMNSHIRRLIRFAPLNLTEEPYPFRFSFDIVFCRNVLIYFDMPLAVRVVNNLVKTLKPSGLLFLGHSETGMMTSTSAGSVGPAAYRKK